MKFFEIYLLKVFGKTLSHLWIYAVNFAVNNAVKNMQDSANEHETL